MKAFTGQAQLHIDEHTAHVSISLNPQAGEFEAEMLSSALPEELFSMHSGSARVVRLTDIAIPLPTGTLECAELADVYLGGSGGVTSSIDETPISRALNLAGDRSGIRRITLSPRAAVIHFVHTPLLEELSELYFLNNFTRGIPGSVVIDTVEIGFHPRNSSLSITASDDLRPWLAPIRAAWSVFQGAHLTHVASYNQDGSIDLVVQQPRAYNKGSSLFRGWQNQQPMLQALVNFFVQLGEDEFKGWEKAITFYLEGRNSELDYDVRIIGLMIFIEMFDGSRTMSRQPIATEFECSLELADFLVRMRNKLIHNRMTLWNAVPLVHTEILQHQSEWVCPELAFSSQNYEMNSILFFLQLEKMVNSYIVRQANYSGEFDDNSDLIVDIESRMV
jgi:hypothetical protein